MRLTSQLGVHKVQLVEDLSPLSTLKHWLMDQSSLLLNLVPLKLEMGLIHSSVLWGGWFDRAHRCCMGAPDSLLLMTTTQRRGQG